jgi:hypothetical protein
MKWPTLGGFLAALVSVALAGHTVSPSPAETEDCYRTALTRSWVELSPEDVIGFSGLETTVYRSGDRIALGAVHAFSHKDLLDPRRLVRILNIVRVSFSRPYDIEREDDKNPAVTMLLLSVLDHDCSDSELNKKIAETRKYIVSQLHIQDESETRMGGPAFVRAGRVAQHLTWVAHPLFAANKGWGF